MNRLSNSTSPYLLQHAGNPVDWFPWGVEALEKSKTDNKPIFLSIGYAACHWCHVMAHESFEDQETAAFMNEHFINIKVDREERPDLDSIYMQALVAMTGSGGWPMSVFLAPDLKPFYSGTYFPPVRRYNMPAFKDVLSGIASAWREGRDEIEKVGSRVHVHLQNQIADSKTGSLSREQLDLIAKTLYTNYDWSFGGWGDAPKFPQPMVLEFLLHNDVMNGTKVHLNLVTHCLDVMARGGMYDVVGGGFARYSTDQFWKVPHFEKMAYDNALLLRTYLHAWQVTRIPSYKRVVTETLDFVIREMTDANGGFYSSLDADSEGEEGRYYVWTIEEIRDILKGEADFFAAAYGITSRGNWEGKTVLQRAMDDASLAARFKLDPEDIPKKLADAHSRLYSARARRVRPGTDDKVLTAWNGLMLAAFSECGRVLGEQTYLEVASRNAEFMLSTLRPNGQLRRAWRNGRTTNEYFLEDYASLILGLLELYQTDFDTKWFVAARDLTNDMIEKFNDPNGGFYDTPDQSEALLIRPKDLQDNATPCGNSLACEALVKLAAFTGEEKYLNLAQGSLALITDFVLKNPLGFGKWLSVAMNANGILRQIAILGEKEDPIYERMIRTVQQEYHPGAIIASSIHPPKEGSPELLRGRPLINGHATAYICEGFICNRPVNEVDELITQLSS